MQEFDYSGDSRVRGAVLKSFLSAFGPYVKRGEQFLCKQFGVDTIRDDDDDWYSLPLFLKAMEGLADYEVTGAPFLSWLYYIARARTVDYWRRQQRWQKVALLHPLLEKAPRPEETVSRRDEWDAVLDVLHELTDDQQQVILLRFIEEMELEEVAAVLNKTVGAVKSLQHRALASLARLLKTETQTGE